MNRPSQFSAKDLTNAPKQDLRTWLDQMDAADELQLIKGANRDEEIGAIVDFYQRQTGNRAVLVADTHAMELIVFWRRYMNEAKTLPPLEVPTGLLMQNVMRGADVDLQKIP